MAFVGIEVMGNSIRLRGKSRGFYTLYLKRAHVLLEVAVAYHVAGMSRCCGLDIVWLDYSFRCLLSQQGPVDYLQSLLRYAGFRHGRQDTLPVTLGGLLAQ